MYQIRAYRNWIENHKLASFEVKIGESDLFIRADKSLMPQAQTSLKQQRRLIEDYIREDPEFATTLKAYSVRDAAPSIVCDMAAASCEASVGPMAAVAGAIAEYVGRDLLKYSSQVMVENGGDIFMKTNQLSKIGIFAGKTDYTGKLALEILPCKDGLGICTSSATVGPSLSLGSADAAIVICDSASLADAWATRLGNMLKAACDIEKVLDFVKQKPNIKGAVLILDDKIGVWGNIKLVKT